jgi:hypothetical protein
MSTAPIKPRRRSPIRIAGHTKRGAKSRSPSPKQTERQKGVRSRSRSRSTGASTTSSGDAQRKETSNPTTPNTAATHLENPKDHATPPKKGPTDESIVLPKQYSSRMIIHQMGELKLTPFCEQLREGHSTEAGILDEKERQQLFDLLRELDPSLSESMLSAVYQKMFATLYMHAGSIRTGQSTGFRAPELQDRGNDTIQAGLWILDHIASLVSSSSSSLDAKINHKASTQVDTSNVAQSSATATTGTAGCGQVHATSSQFYHSNVAHLNDTGNTERVDTQLSGTKKTDTPATNAQPREIASSSSSSSSLPLIATNAVTISVSLETIYT